MKWRAKGVVKEIHAREMVAPRESTEGVWVAITLLGLVGGKGAVWRSVVRFAAGLLLTDFRLMGLRVERCGQKEGGISKTVGL
ncbi:hypothetical protein KKB83_05115 [Patescibacteria group bacterium]|nr:hypothetical protein [Patescibacteria group bacterium]